jgi:ammonia channel protein AmtB
MPYRITLTAIILKVLDATMGLRVKDEEEIEGLDFSHHSEHMSERRLKYAENNGP